METVYVGCVELIVSMFPNEVKYSVLYFTWKCAENMLNYYKNNKIRKLIS